MVGLPAERIRHCKDQKSPGKTAEVQNLTFGNINRWKDEAEKKGTGKVNEESKKTQDHLESGNA